MSFDRFLKQRLPRAWFWFRFWKYRYTRKGEPEIRLIRKLVKPGSVAVDVGASVGFYAAEMSRYASHVFAFEANPEVAEFARKVATRKVEVFATALSSSRGGATLRVPLNRRDRVVTELATLAASNALDGRPVVKVEVTKRCLDDFAIEGCRFIKIDVEGHEEDVIAGGWSLVSRDRPVLMVEMSDTFNPGVFGRLTASSPLWDTSRATCGTVRWFRPMISPRCRTAMPTW